MEGKAKYEQYNNKKNWYRLGDLYFNTATKPNTHRCDTLNLNKMIKKITLILTLLITAYSFAFGQEKFIYNQKGLNPKYVIVEIDSLKQNELFKKTINWIKETYRDPDEVIKATIDNEKIRFEGFVDNLICHGTWCFYTHYIIEIEFKDNKYKFTPMEVRYRRPATQYTASEIWYVNFDYGASSYNGHDYSYYKKNGNLKNLYKTIPSSVETLFNRLNMDLSKYLLTKKKNNDTGVW